MQDKLEIIHDETNKKFFTIINGSTAYLQYIFINTNTINMIKTYVPVSLRGQGIAAQIVKVALMFAQKNNFKVIPSCSYVETFIERHTEYKNLLL